MSTPTSNLEAIRDAVVDYLIAFPDLAALTLRDTNGDPILDSQGNLQTSILGKRKGDLYSEAQMAVQRCGIVVAVFLESAIPRADQSIAVYFDPVTIFIETDEHVTTNQLTADNGGAGTGLGALYIMERIAAALKLWTPDREKITPLMPEKAGIREINTKESAQQGLYCLGARFETRCVAIPRTIA